MAGLIYLIICILTGKELTEAFLFAKERGKETVKNRFWMIFSMAFGVGTLLITWGVYVVSWLLAVCAGSDNPLLWGNLVILLAAALCLALCYVRRRKQGKPVTEYRNLIGDKKRFRNEAIFFVLLILFVTWIMFYVFHIKDGTLYSGFTVFSDYAPQTAMMRSFSLQNNFPTQYPHFGGEDVKYHFMFQFLTGNLEYLGLPIDVAYNLVSIFSLWGFLVMLYHLAVRITGCAAGGVLSVLLFLFRSSFSFFIFLWEHMQAGDLLTTLKENTAFIGYTLNENWGLWNFNVYLNQRHLAFGLLLVSGAIWIYLDWLEAGNNHPSKGLKWMRDRMFTREAWKCRNPETALAVGLILGLSAFWNGAAEIGCLLILMGFALFSDGKLDYLLTAIVAVLFSVLQTKIFIQGSSIGVSFYWGFLADQKTPAGVLTYLLIMSGIFFLGLVVLVFFFDRMQRSALVAFLIPVLFAFTASLTPDITVNHKYIMIAYAYLTMFWAAALCRLWIGVRKREPTDASGVTVSSAIKKAVFRLAAVVMIVCLTITGVYEFVIILRNDGVGRRVQVNLNSALTEWLAENLDHEDLILTPQYSMNEVTMSGVMLYCGWPYYAWSAGYDTDYRSAKAVEIYTSEDEETVQAVVEQEEITYILFEDGMTFEEQDCREDVIARLYPLVYETEDGRIRIYKTEQQTEAAGLEGLN